MDAVSVLKILCPKFIGIKALFKANAISLSEKPPSGPTIKSIELEGFSS